MMFLWQNYVMTKTHFIETLVYRNIFTYSVVKIARDRAQEYCILDNTFWFWCNSLCVALHFLGIFCILYLQKPSKQKRFDLENQFNASVYLMHMQEIQTHLDMFSSDTNMVYLSYCNSFL